MPFLQHNMNALALALVLCVVVFNVVANVETEEAGSVTSLRDLKVKFLEMVSGNEMDTQEAKGILSQIPKDLKSFHDDDDLVDPLNPMIAKLAVAILHHLLNKFMLAPTFEEKNQLLQIIQMGIERGMDVSATHKDDPPLYVKGIFVREMNLTANIISAGHKFITHEVIARSQKMSRFLTTLYGLPGEVVPPAKLLLHVQKIAASRASTAPDTNRTSFAHFMLRGARLDKPTIKASELLQFSDTYRGIVERLTTTPASDISGQQVSLWEVMTALSEYAEIGLQAVLDALMNDPRRTVALEHFFDLHVLQDAQERTPLHYITMGRAHTLLDRLTHTLQECMNSLWASSSFTREAVAAKLLIALAAEDVRGHSPVSYVTMRYHRQFGNSHHQPEHGAHDIAFAVRRMLAVLREQLREEDALELWTSLDADLVHLGTDADGEDQPPVVGQDAEVSVDGSVQASDSNMIEHDDGGWNPAALHVSAETLPYVTPASHCDVLEVIMDDSFPTQLPDQVNFFAKYINTGTPVVFRGAMLHGNNTAPHTRMHALREVFRKDNFLRNYGSKKVSASSLPYGESFGVHVAMKSMRQVAQADEVVDINHWLHHPDDNTSATSTAPLYTFTVPSADWGARMLREVPLPEPLSVLHTNDGNSEPTIAEAYSTQLQFYLGAAGTGAPVHYHGPAVNSLAYGEKHWVLYPPEVAFYSTVSALQFFTSASQDLAAQGGLQCRQRAGDMMFVPALWSHATLNMRQSIGVAHEFSVEQFCME